MGLLTRLLRGRSPLQRSHLMGACTQIPMALVVALAIGRPVHPVRLMAVWASVQVTVTAAGFLGRPENLPALTGAMGLVAAWVGYAASSMRVHGDLLIFSLPLIAAQMAQVYRGIHLAAMVACFCGAAWIPFLAARGQGPTPLLPLLTMLITVSVSSMMARVQESLRQTEQRALDLARQAQENSRRDPLTGLLNRRGFQEVAQRDLARALREGRDVSVLMLDLDHFKQVNDTHGHATGDRVLQTVSKAVAATVREYDLVARWGGEEICIFLPDVGHRDSLATVAEKVRTAIADCRVPSPLGGALCISASVGGAVGALMPASSTAASITALIAAADEALYQAKAQGRNRVVLK